MTQGPSLTFGTPGFLGVCADSVTQGESPFTFLLVPPCPWFTHVVDTLAPVQVPPLTLTAVTWAYLALSCLGREFQAPGDLHLVSKGAVGSEGLCPLGPTILVPCGEGCGWRGASVGSLKAQRVGLLLPRFKAVLCKCHL